MCVSPSFVYADKGPDFERRSVACGWCWACQKNRLNDLVARSLCEQATSDWVYMVNLTYRPSNKPLTAAARKNDKQKIPNPLQYQFIHKEDFQKFQKYLRHSVKTRYLVAGEFGKNGTARAHFHVILFGKGRQPTWEHLKNTHIDEWPWGHVYIDPNVSETNIRYVTKYLLKEQKRKKDGTENKFQTNWVSYSRIPIMGADYVSDLATRYAAERVFPHSFKYRPPFASDNREYQFIGETRNVFFDVLFALWPEAREHKKNEAMQRAYQRYIKDRAQKRWDKLPSDQQKKALDLNARNVTSLQTRELYLLGRFFITRLKETNVKTIAEFKRTQPQDYALCYNAFRRDLTQNPPTYEETGLNIPSGIGLGHNPA